MIIVTKTTTEGEEKDFRWEWVPAPSESPRYVGYYNKLCVFRQLL